MLGHLEYLALFTAPRRKSSVVIREFYADKQKNPVYHRKLLKPLTPGLSFLFKGFILITCEKFTINFLVDKSKTNIALQLNARLPQNYIVRNSKKNGRWGKDEIASELSFTLHRGGTFTIQVLVTHDFYMIGVNGYHFAAYKHRISYKHVQAVEILGEVRYIQMDSYVVTEYPTRYPNSMPAMIQTHFDDDSDEIEHWVLEPEIDVPTEFRFIGITAKRKTRALELHVPYYVRLPQNSLFEGRYIRIQGRVRLLPHSFIIYLQKGQDIWPQTTVAFFFNPIFSKKSGRLDKAVVIRNSYENGKWVKEEVSQLHTHLSPGKPFNLAIVCTSKAFEVYVNCKYVLNYKYQVNPDVVDMVNIRGDVKLWDVVMGSASIFQKRKNIRTEDFRRTIKVWRI